MIPAAWNTILGEWMFVWIGMTGIWWNPPRSTCEVSAPPHTPTEIRVENPEIPGLGNLDNYLTIEEISSN